VDLAAENMLRAKLIGSRFSDPDQIEDMVEEFEKRVRYFYICVAFLLI
jgi:hypothetical protein